MVPDFERDQPDQSGGPGRARSVRTYGATCDVVLSARPYFEALRCAAKLSWRAVRRLAEASGDDDLARPTWDVIPGELVEFFRTRTDVSIMLPERAA